ncbi:hypothetical protein [Curtobacterium sp. MCBD17_040]|uniref:hypothetical protein n=1 Tax=Curtobacterium sp. MCBD17_040 TaxID=2175674 RepID=UPI000DA805A0|nr:hypothetical protein [Curtobacterium sp. MCBD17_040]WIB65677.1 hypothetical protein DEI94_16280 [Curtobacterium sp. MCBD17_040]
MTNTDPSFDDALAAAKLAAPHLDDAALTAVVTAVADVYRPEVRALQVALATTNDSVVEERATLTAAQLWFSKHGNASTALLGDILAGHSAYGFDPDSVEGLDPAIVAEAAVETWLRERAHANALLRELQGRG